MVVSLVLMWYCCYRVTEKGNYTEMDAAHIIRQILQGVQYLHSHGGSLASCHQLHSAAAATDKEQVASSTAVAGPADDRCRSRCMSILGNSS